ncbi:MAG: 50S ribosomal protein L23 [Coriobacteriales bacterium]|jgi:large subunit ribosomal protein L23|nr:50S ribosomal protein L23 [Coriobacteriales bacterium]
MKDVRQVILRPIISERSYDLLESNRYTFEVAKKANKVEIGQAVEEIFDVTVLKVNTMNVSGKPKRVRYAKGYTRSWKKAIITLKEGDKIEAFGV